MTIFVVSNLDEKRHYDFRTGTRSEELCLTSTFRPSEVQCVLGDSNYDTVSDATVVYENVAPALFCAVQKLRCATMRRTTKFRRTPQLYSK